MFITATETRPLRIVLGANGGSEFDPGVPVLAGEDVEELFGVTRVAGQVGPLVLFHADGWLLGGVTVPLVIGLEATTRCVYADILHATRGLNLARVWNYVPAINERGAAGLENYRIFCRGRSLAFEKHFGPGFKSRLPSASAVGSLSSSLTVVFAASLIAPRHVENPLQVAAYEYPGEYGPRPPSFARASVVSAPASSTVFISGTAAIRGHATIAPRDVREQLTCTLENLREISKACGVGSDLDRGGGSTRHFKIYLRRESDQSQIAAMLDEELLASSDHVSYLRADMCRAPLLVEIEASLFGVTSLR